MTKNKTTTDREKLIRRNSLREVDSTTQRKTNNKIRQDVEGGEGEIFMWVNAGCRNAV